MPDLLTAVSPLLGFEDGEITNTRSRAIGFTVLKDFSPR